MPVPVPVPVVTPAPRIRPRLSTRYDAAPRRHRSRIPQWRCDLDSATGRARSRPSLDVGPRVEPGVPGRRCALLAVTRYGRLRAKYGGTSVPGSHPRSWLPPARQPAHVRAGIARPPPRCGRCAAWSRRNSITYETCAMIRALVVGTSPRTISRSTQWAKKRAASAAAEPLGQRRRQRRRPQRRPRRSGSDRLAHGRAVSCWPVRATAPLLRGGEAFQRLEPVLHDDKAEGQCGVWAVR